MGNQQASLFEGKKTCRRCGEEKPVTEFRVFRAKGRKTSITAICIPCDKKWHQEHYLEVTTPEKRKMLNERARQWRRDHPETTKAKAKHWHAVYRERDRKIVYSVYGGKCVCCGEIEAMFLTVDHVNSDGHIERKKGLYTNGSQFYRWIIQNNFPKDYQLLCFNCNLGRARNNGTCPHQEASTAIPSGSTPKRAEALGVR